MTDDRRAESQQEVIVTPEQFQQGWIELNGVTPVHRQFLLLRIIDDGHYVVRNPEFRKQEQP